jgi:hypothetical protein
MDGPIRPDSTKPSVIRRTSRKLVVELIGTLFLLFTVGVGLNGGVIALLGWPALSIYFVAELVAAVAAGFAFRALNAGDSSQSRESPVPLPVAEATKLVPR